MEVVLSDQDGSIEPEGRYGAKEGGVTKSEAARIRAIYRRWKEMRWWEGHKDTSRFSGVQPLLVGLFTGILSVTIPTSVLLEEDHLEHITDWVQHKIGTVSAIDPKLWRERKNGANSTFGTTSVDGPAQKKLSKSQLGETRYLKDQAVDTRVREDHANIQTEKAQLDDIIAILKGKERRSRE